jgi:hypothetical protein
MVVSSFESFYILSTIFLEIVEGHFPLPQFKVSNPNKEVAINTTYSLSADTVISHIASSVAQEDY